MKEKLPELFYIDEPELSFGFNQKTADPRDGLMLFGPHDRAKTKGQVNIGVIGCKKQREYFKAYLQRIHQPVKPSEVDPARPFFPGLEAAFGIHVNFENIIEIDISESEVNKYMGYTDGNLRVHNLSNLFTQELSKYMREEERPVTVWFVIIQDDIYKFGKPKSKIPKAETNVKDRLKKNERNSSSPLLFPEYNAMQEAYDYEINFHNQIKAKLLEDKVVTQIIKESTIAYEQLWTNDQLIQKQKLFDSAKAWNIATTFYYKAGGLPWRLGDIRPDVCYLGLVYKKLNDDPNNRSACCAAQMFIDSGDGMVFRGNIGNWYNPKTKEFHIGKKEAVDMVRQSLEAFKEKLGNGNYPKEVFIHAKTLFSDEEWGGFTEEANGKSQIIGVRIQTTGHFKLYRGYCFCVPRGMTMKIDDRKAYLWTKGFIPRLQTQIGLETPNCLSVEITRGAADIKQVCKDVLALTKLNYNACIFADGEPVTLRFADSIGEVLTAGKNVKTYLLPFKHYV